jgi:pimeloyl-ACP methyl ester carboxylesterase
MTETRSAGLEVTASSQGTQAREPEAPRAELWSRPRAPHRETTVMGLCVAALVTHVLDDSFVQPEPGTTAGDHLASGLIPVLLLVATAVVYVRLRAGLRATVAMTLGALGLVIGIPSAYYLRLGALEGDHYTGLLALVAGAGLLLAGPVILWRNRRSGGTRRQRCLRRAAILAVTPVLALALGWFVIFPIGLGYVYTHTAPEPVEPDVGVPYEPVIVTTDDGLELTASYVPSHNRAAILLYPGASRTDEARILIAHGYGVLLLDPRGQGGSDGDTVRWAGDQDLLAAAAYLQRRPDVDPDRIGAIGFSIGGEMLLRAAARSDSIRAVISEGAGDRVGETDVTGIARVLVDPSQAVMTAATAIFSNHLPPPPIADRIGDISPRPVLLIYADPGAGGESTSQPEYFAAASEPKAIWKVPGSSHTGGIDAQPVEYERRVTTFFDAALLDPTRRPERSGP